MRAKTIDRVKALGVARDDYNKIMNEIKFLLRTIHDDPNRGMSNATKTEKFLMLSGGHYQKILKGRVHPDFISIMNIVYNSGHTIAYLTKAINPDFYELAERYRSLPEDSKEKHSFRSKISPMNKPIKINK